MRLKLLQSRWWIIFLLFLGALISAVDRGSIASAVPFMMKDLQIDPLLSGVILSSFFWAYAAMNIPAGVVADKVGPKATLGWSAVIWSLFSASTGLATRFWQVLLVRLGVGLGEAAVNPCNTKIIRANFSSEERGTAVGWYLPGFRIGFGAAPVLMGYLIQWFSWRRAFLVTSLLSSSWAVLWYFTYRERKAAAPALAAPATKIPWRTLLRHRSILGLVLCKFFQDYTFYLFVSWLPTYLVKERGLTLIKGSWYAAIPWVAAFLFQAFAGGSSDWLLRRGVSRTLARKGPIICMQLLAVVVVVVGYVDSPTVAIVLLAVSLVFESGSSVVLWAVCAEVAPDKAAGSVGGIMNTAGAIAGILAPVVTGFLVKTTGNFQWAMVVGGLMFGLGALSMWLVVGKVETIPLEPGPGTPEPALART